jgi:hypothetical protein
MKCTATLPPIQPEEGSISTSVTADTSDKGTADMLKCSLQQCKNTDASANLFLVVTKNVAKRFNILAIWPFW